MNLITPARRLFAVGTLSILIHLGSQSSEWCCFSSRMIWCPRPHPSYSFLETQKPALLSHRCFSLQASWQLRLTITGASLTCAIPNLLLNRGSWVQSHSSRNLKQKSDSAESRGGWGISWKTTIVRKCWCLWVREGHHLCEPTPGQVQDQRDQQTMFLFQQLRYDGLPGSEHHPTRGSLKSKWWKTGRVLRWDGPTGLMCLSLCWWYCFRKLWNT